MKNVPIKKIISQAAFIIMLSLVAGLGINELRTDGIGLIGTYRPDEQAENADYRGTSVIAAEDAMRFHERGMAVFVDARSQLEYEEGHIPGAVSIPQHEADEHIDTFLKTVPISATIITYCDGEYCHLSKDLALFLKERGYRDARVFVNGWGVWLSRGCSVERGKKSDNAIPGGASQ